MKGKVKFFDRKKGFGFIKGDDETEYFVHYSGLKEGVELNENDEVVFEVEKGDKGEKAVQVDTNVGTEEAEEPQEQPEESQEEPEEESEEKTEDSE